MTAPLLDNSMKPEDVDMIAKGITSSVRDFVLSLIGKNAARIDALEQRVLALESRPFMVGTDETGEALMRLRNGEHVPISIIDTVDSIRREGRTITIIDSGEERTVLVTPPLDHSNAQIVLDTHVQDIEAIFESGY